MFLNMPLTALRTFESAARLGSFKQAAEELAVTPTAVSHQIRRLEQALGVSLFERLPRAVRLTVEGHRLFERLHDAFLDISEALDGLRPRPREASLLVSTTHSFAALWLIPRLSRFYGAHPGVAVCLDTRPDPVDLHRNAGVDVAIRYGAGEYAGLYGPHRLSETFGVYGAPTRVETAAAKSPTRITVEWQGSALYADGWRAWCAAAGEDWLDGATPVHAYEEEYHALQAAIAGQGLLLGSSVMVSDSVHNGLLVPYRPQISVPGAAYTALCVPGRHRHPPVRAFLAWLQSEFESGA